MAKSTNKLTREIVIVSVAIVCILVGCIPVSGNSYTQILLRKGHLLSMVGLPFFSEDYHYPNLSENYLYPYSDSIVFHENIEVPTDQDLCVAVVRAGLNIADPNNEIAALSWKMSGATESDSPEKGINHINSFSFNKGITFVMYKGKDIYSNSFSCSFSVSVSDEQAPRLVNSPGNIRAVSSPGECGTEVSWSLPTAVDNCVSSEQIQISSNYPPGAIFPIGSTEVSYKISDGQNSINHTFNVIVVDIEAPLLTAPEKVVVNCGEAVPDAFTTWKEFKNAGGMASDNCGLNYASFKYVRQASSSIFCPYTVTRTYSIADVYGNISEAKHVINVIGEENTEKTKDGQLESNDLLKSASGNKSASVTVVNIKHVSCNGGNDGSIDLDTTSTNGPITKIEWDHGPTTLDVSGLSAGTYTLNVTDADGTVSVNYTITQPAVLNASTSSENITCNGANDGTITISSSIGGSGTYEYRINSGTWQSSTSFSGLSPGNYTVEIRDAVNIGCVQSLGSETITQPAVLNATTSSEDITCNGANDGTITISSSIGGSGTYEYRINSGTWQSSTSFSGLSPGSYSVEIRDAVNTGCVQSLGSETITQPAVLSATAASENITCNGANDGTITISSASGGSSTYEYRINSGAWQSSAGFSGLAPGNYTVEIRDAVNSGCVQSLGSETITEPAVLSALTSSENITCNGANDGIITISSASGGLGTYEYRINGGTWQSSTDFSSLAPGNYTVEIRDAVNTECVQNLGSVALNEPEPLIAPVISSGQTICYNYVPAQLVGTSASGGNGGYDYQWQKSPDNISWANIGGETAQTYSPSALTLTTYFRLAVSDAVMPTCETVYSNSVEISVVDDEPPLFKPPGNITLNADGSCNVNVDPAIAGSVTGLSDNCSELGKININYTDGDAIPGTCSGTYSFERTWTVTDEAGNDSVQIQLIAVRDIGAPTLILPSDITIECHEDRTPDGTGYATATDNCDASGTVSITWSDTIVPGNCTGREEIYRTWTATDCSGNKRSDVQLIRVEDNTPPVINCPVDFHVNTPDDIPYLSEMVVTATDNCGETVSVDFLEERYTGLEAGAGFCPETVTRIYVATDPCGNKDTCDVVIYVDDLSDCYICQSEVPLYHVDLQGQPSGSVTLENIGREQEGVCCDFKSKKTLRCVSFNLELDPEAVGVTMLVDGALPSSKDYRLNCFEVAPIGDVVCIPGDDVEVSEFYTFVYCKEGANLNDFSFISIPGAIGTGDLTTRVDCSGEINVEGVTESSVTFTDISGNNYERFLNPPSGSLNPTFTPDSTAPPIIRYEVCGDLEGDGVVCSGGSDCSIVEIVILPKININFDVDPQAVCENNPPTIHVSINPAPSQNYEYEYYWYNGYEAQGSPINSVSTLNFQPSVEGPYSIKVIETKTGVICNEAVHNFDWIFDITEPSVFSPSADLDIECNDPNAAQLIQDWLATATAEDEDGNSLVVTNNYSGVAMGCNIDLPVVFSASDDCGNIGRDTAYIRVRDNLNPVITQEASDDIVDCSTINPDEHSLYLEWLANHGGATATDNCDADLTWSADTATAIWIGDGHRDSITVTFTVTDDCENAVQTTAIFTVVDDVPPTITCPENVTEIVSPNQCSKIPDSLTDPIYSDECSNPVLTWSSVGALNSTGNGTVTGLTFPVGTTTVTYTVTDDAGLTAECEFLVTIVDTVPPDLQISGCRDVTEEAAPNNCSKVPDTMLEPDYLDNCWPSDSLDLNFVITGALDSVGEGSVSGISFPVGVSYVTYTVTDPDGYSDQCSFFVTIVDVTPPNLEISNCQNVVGTMDADDCFALPPAIADPFYSDDCWHEDSLVLSFEIVTEGGLWDTMGIGYVSGFEFPVGVSTVTYTVTDPDSNFVNCSFTVTMQRDEIPFTSIICPSDPAPVTIVNGACEMPVAVAAPTIDEYCETATYTITNNYTSGTTNADTIYPVGITEVVWTISDNSGNDTTCTVYVEVIGTNDPVITCPPNVVGTMDADECFAVPPAIPEPGYSASCWDTDSLVLTFEIVNGTWDTTGVGSVAGVQFPVGVNTVTYTVTDPDSNFVDCSFTVTMRRDEIPFTSVICPSDPAPVTITNGACEMPVAVAAPTIDEYCETATYTITNNYTSGTTSADTIYPVGITEVVWTISDNSGNDTTCTVYVEVIGTNDPVITCPSNVVATMDADECFAVPPAIPELGYSAPCWDIDSLLLTFEIVNGTWDTTGVGSVFGIEFPVGVNTVTYTVTDPDSNFVDCSFTVTMLPDEIPSTIFNCPENPANVTVDSFSCDAYVSIAPPTLNKHCETASYTITHDSPYGADSSDASGYYEIGVHTVTWTIADNLGNETTCSQTFEVYDLEPRLICPSSIEVWADFDHNYASGVMVGLPDFWDNCDSTLTYTITTPDSITTLYKSGQDSINLLEGTHTYDLGVTVIEYTFKDGHGHTVDCEFTVTVIGAPDIDCPPDTTIYLDLTENDCDATFDPGVPDLIEGVPPIKWTYTIHFADGNTTGPVSYEKDATDPYANPLGDINFPSGVTTIEWRAENEAGYDTCSHWVEVIDTVPPSFITKPYENCVNPIEWAIYNPTHSNPIYGVDPNLEKSPSPDYRILEAGDTALDLLTLSDNCCDSTEMILKWRIEFTDVPDPLNPTGPYLTHPDITGTGQPSVYLDPVTGFPTDIYLWGDGVTYTTVVHHIFYRVVDCNGNTSEEVMEEIRITPRPEIRKEAY
uniref:HYR domain-containing protein n=1 Tax=uncultured Draconibacterium sp. TaxID=1573823 RepID=UPI003216F304